MEPASRAQYPTYGISDNSGLNCTMVKKNSSFNNRNISHLSCYETRASIFYPWVMYSDMDTVNRHGQVIFAIGGVFSQTWTQLTLSWIVQHQDHMLYLCETCNPACMYNQAAICSSVYSVSFDCYTWGTHLYGYCMQSVWGNTEKAQLQLIK